MSTFWSSAVSDGWAVFADVATGLLPVIGTGLGLALVGVVVSYFVGRR